MTRNDRAGFLALLPVVAMLAACQVAAANGGAAGDGVAGGRAAGGRAAGAVARGRAYAAANCSACHAIGATGVSANSDAPTFAMLVNEKGATARSLAAWLKDAHNYPQEMDLYLLQPEAEALAAYMVTLKGKGGHRARPPAT